MLQRDLIAMGITEVCIKMEKITFSTVKKMTDAPLNAQGQYASIDDIPVGFKLNKTTIEIGLDDINDLFDRAMYKVGEIVYNSEYKRDYYQYCVAIRAAMLRKVLKNNAYYRGTSPDVDGGVQDMAIDAAAGGGAAAAAPVGDSEQTKQMKAISLIGQYMPQKPDANELLNFYEKVNELIDSVTEHLLSGTRERDIYKQLRISRILLSEFRQIDERLRTLRNDSQWTEHNILNSIGMCIQNLYTKYDRDEILASALLLIPAPQPVVVAAQAQAGVGNAGGGAAQAGVGSTGGGGARAQGALSNDNSFDISKFNDNEYKKKFKTSLASFDETKLLNILKVLQANSDMNSVTQVMNIIAQNWKSMKAEVTESESINDIIRSIVAKYPEQSNATKLFYQSSFNIKP